jgi:hypothetical protein
MDVQADNVAEASISAVVIRADGTVEDLGVISSYKRPKHRTLRIKLSRILEGRSKWQQ